MLTSHALMNRMRGKNGVKPKPATKPATKPAILQQRLFRLPDGAKFQATYDASDLRWSGSLDVDGLVFKQTGSAIHTLMMRLGKSYLAHSKIKTA